MSSDPILESHRKRLQQHREFLGNTSGSKDGNFQASQEKPLPPMNRTDIPSRAHKDSANEQSKPKDGSYLSDASGILHVSYHHGNNELNSSTSPRDAGEVMGASRPTLIEHSHPNKNLNAHFSTSQGNESNSYPPASSGRTFSSSVPADGALRVCMRGQRWARIREENLHRQRQAALEEQLRECTFSPCLSDSLTNDGARIPPDSTHLHKGNPSQYSDSNKDGDRSQERMIDRLLGLEPTPEFQPSYSPADWAPHGLNEYDSDPGQTRGYLYTQNPPGFEDYIERQEEARRRRNACLARQTIRTDKWCNRVTVPVPFHIGEPISVRLSGGGKNDSVQRSPRKESPLSLEQPFHDELCLVQNSTIRIPKDMTTATSRSQALRAFEDIVRTGLVASDASNDDATRKPYVSRDTRHAQNKVHASTESAQVSTKESARTVDTLYSSSPAFCATGEEYDEGDFSPDPVTISSYRVRGTPQSVQLRGQGVSVALIRENATLRKMVIDKELKIRNLMDQLRKGSTSIERVS